jgi:hypothetical protein
VSVEPLPDVPVVPVLPDAPVVPVEPVEPLVPVVPEPVVLPVLEPEVVLPVPDVPVAPGSLWLREASRPQPARPTDNARTARAIALRNVIECIFIFRYLRVSRPAQIAACIRTSASAWNRGELSAIFRRGAPGCFFLPQKLRNDRNRKRFGEGAKTPTERRNPNLSALPEFGPPVPRKHALFCNRTGRIHEFARAYRLENPFFGYAALTRRPEGPKRTPYGERAARRGKYRRANGPIKETRDAARVEHHKAHGICERSSATSGRFGDVAAESFARMSGFQHPLSAHA